MKLPNLPKPSISDSFSIPGLILIAIGLGLAWIPLGVIFLGVSALLVGIGTREGKP